MCTLTFLRTPGDSDESARTRTCRRLFPSEAPKKTAAPFFFDARCRTTPLFALEFGIPSPNDCAVHALLRNERPVHTHNFARLEFWTAAHSPMRRAAARASARAPPPSIRAAYDAIRASLSPARYEGLIGVLHGY